MTPLLKKYYFLLLALWPWRANGQSFVKTSFGVTLLKKNQKISISFFSPTIVHITKIRSGSENSVKSLSVIRIPQKIPLLINHNEKYLSIESSKLRVLIDLRSGNICYKDIFNRTLLAEAQQKEKSNIYVLQQSFILDSNEAIYGLGQHQNGYFNQRNKTILLKQQNMSIAIPFFQSSKGYGILWDNCSVTQFKDSANIATFSSEHGNDINYYFISGNTPDEVIASYRFLTGSVPLLPLWAFGYWQSRERYRTGDELFEVVDRYRKIGVPLDGVIQDWQYWNTDETHWNEMIFDTTRFPNISKTIDRIHQANAKLLISVWPSFGEQTAIYRKMKQGNMLYNFTTWPINPRIKVYDAFDSTARKIYWHYLKTNLWTKGVDGWWLDASEPEHLKQKPEDENTPTALGSFGKICNAYPLMHTGGVYNGQRSISNKRVFILTRSAFTGQQRFGTMLWSGDVQGNWETLKKQIPAALNMTMSGFPYWNSDIGGFFIKQQYPSGTMDLAYKELYVRWIQFSVFCGMMRSHGTDAPREIYQFGKRGEWAFDAIEKFIRLRYRLLPYIYSVSWRISSAHGSLMRPLIMDFMNDKQTYDIGYEYLFGKSLLVNPITEPIGIGANDKTEKTIVSNTYLPEGTDWIDFWTAEHFKGGQIVSKGVGIEEIPIYVRAGSILPLAPVRQYSDKSKWDTLELRIYSGANGFFELYEDEYYNYNYERGYYTTIDFRWNEKTRTLSIGERKGHFNGMIKKRIFYLVLVAENRGLGIEESSSIDKIVTYEGKALNVRF